MRQCMSRALVFSGCLLVTLAGCQRPALQTLHPEVLSKVSLQYYWDLDLRLGADQTVTHLLQMDENVYCLTNKNRLIAIDAARGLPKWQRSVADPSATLFLPTHATGSH